MRKNLTQDIIDILKDRKPVVVDWCIAQLESKGIKYIFNVSELDLSSKGIYGNHVVIMNDGTFVDLDICDAQIIEFVVNTNFE